MSNCELQTFLSSRGGEEKEFLKPLLILTLKIESLVLWASGLLKNCNDYVDVRYGKPKKFQLMALLSVNESPWDIYSSTSHENQTLRGIGANNCRRSFLKQSGKCKYSFTAKKCGSMTYVFLNNLNFKKSTVYGSLKMDSILTS